MAILILAPGDDLHAQRVTACLEALGERPVAWSLADLLTRSELTLNLRGPKTGCALKIGRHPDEPVVDLMSFRSIWLRRPGTVKAPEMPESWLMSFAECESTRALGSIFALMPGLWVNSPVAQQRANLKLHQLKLAADAGLAVPDTLVTNSPDDAAAFIDRLDGNVVYKMIDQSSWEHFPSYEIPRGVPTMPLRDVDREHLSQVAYSMHLFQEKVRKRYDVRITIVGEKMFPVRIDSQAGAGKTDCRLDYSVPMSVEELPKDVAESCLALMNRLGLEFGAMDLALAEDGRYHFFEVNPAGQWLWMEQGLGLPIANELARLLAGKDNPRLTNLQ